jgi:GTPase SAR1 family protein
LRGGLLTQERLGELLGEELGDRGYSGAAVSDWERDQSQIHKDDRAVLIALMNVLNQTGGLSTMEEANELLLLGNYRALDSGENQQIFRGNLAETGKTSSAVDAPRNTLDEESLPPQKLSQNRRKQLVLLEKVNNFWVEGVYEHSLENDLLIDLELLSTHEPINHPWSDVLGRTFLSSENTTENDIASLYNEVDRALLILGDPGSGKTILLISLARELINRANRQADEPIPVILNLASWVQRRTSLLDWAAFELTAKYQIPRRLAKSWLLEDALVLLLDGLDEVPDRFRRQCIQNINDFRKNNGLTGMVVCCRSEEYAAARTPLQLNGATIIQPLKELQIADYLNASSNRGTALEETIKNEAVLQEMATVPLMLNMMLRAFEANTAEVGKTIDNIGARKAISLSTYQDQLFDTYVRRMFDRRIADNRYSPHETVIRLNWLARKMFDHNRSVFLIEQIQPDWLPSRIWRWIYMLLSGFILGFVCGIIVWLFWQILHFSSPLMPTPLSNTVGQLLQITQGRAEFVALLVSNIILGLIVAMMQTRYFETLRIHQLEQESRGARYAKHLIIIGAVVALITAIAITLAGVPQLALIWSAAEVVVYVIAARYIFGRSYQNEIRTVEALAWSWKSALNGLLIGLVLAALAEILGLIVYDAPISLQSSLILGSAGVILGGMRGRRVEEKSYANQGIILSLRNSLIAASVGSFILGVITFYLQGAAYALVAAALTFIIGGSLLGGNNVVKHILVRGILWQQGKIPWRYAQFLDHAVRLAFLRKVGGGYIFMHQLLQAYFANYPEDSILSSDEESSSQLSPKLAWPN